MFLEAHRGLCWKRKYPKIKTEKKLSEELLCVLLIRITELQIFPQEAFTKTVFVGFAKWYLKSQRGLWWKWKYLQLKTGEKLSEKLLCVLLIHTQSYTFPITNPFAKTVLVEFTKWYLEAHRGVRLKRKFPHIKTGKKLSEKLLCVLLIHLTVLQLYPQEALH